MTISCCNPLANTYDNHLHVYTPFIQDWIHPSGRLNLLSAKINDSLNIFIQPCTHLETKPLNLPCSYNKSVLTVFPYPITCTVVQFGIGSIMALTMWTLGLHPKPKISKETVPLISIPNLLNVDFNHAFRHQNSTTFTSTDKLIYAPLTSSTCICLRGKNGEVVTYTWNLESYGIPSKQSV